MSRFHVALLPLVLVAPLALAADRPAAPAYKLSAPFSHDNLTVFLILGEDQIKGDVLTLAEALADKKVVVHETKAVNQLSIENLGDRQVFIQAGDIVKGGQQDRTIAFDVLLPPKSGKVPLASFCVESGRWARRGVENARQFSASPYALTDNRLKLACRLSKKQGEVWKEVAKAQKMLGDNLKADVRSKQSATSLQLALEHKKVKEAVEAAVKKLTPALGDRKNVIGYAVAINGKVNNADVFASAALFKKLWPKLLFASSVEAVANKKEKASFDAVKAEAVTKFMAEAATGKASESKTALGLVEKQKETKVNVLFETRSKAGVLLRSSYLAK
jgi:hypothetical protein